MGITGLTLVLATLVACARAPGEDRCPALAAGDVVITEIRGSQSDGAGPPFVELYNASGTDVDLLGTTLRFTAANGSTAIAVIVRRAVLVPPEGYVTLGLASDASRPATIDYGFAGDFRGRAWLPAAALEIASCDTPIDRATYGSLPLRGSYSFGTVPPTAEANDYPTAWCTDATLIGSTYPGTPQAANRCR